MTGRWPSFGVAGERATLWHAPATPGIAPFEDTTPPPSWDAWVLLGHEPGRYPAGTWPVPPQISRGPLPLLYPSLCRLSSPSPRRTAPLLLAGGIDVPRCLGLASDFGDEVVCSPLTEPACGGVNEVWKATGEIRVSHHPSSGMDSACEGPRISLMLAVQHIRSHGSL